jgi:uncharacterized protein
MSHRPVIDGFEFAESGSTLKGEWPIKEFARLRDALFEDSGAIEYELRGVRDARGRAGLNLSISGCLRLACQRCLGCMEFALHIDRRLVLARTPEEIDAESLDEDSPDWLLASKEMPVGALIEDELLLELPLAPRHERCAARAGEVAAQNDSGSPFSGLRGMLEGGKAKH